MLPLKAVAAGAAFLFFGQLTGCACGLPVGDVARLERYPAFAGFERVQLNADGFILHAWLRRGSGASEMLTVVIEGDGAAWFAPGWPPADPTPDRSHIVALAAALPGTVAYLARPCQFAPDAPACRPDHWTTHRFDDPLVTALAAGLDTLKERTGARRLKLIGHSGGGVMAVLLAQNRTDVAGVATFMAPLDLAEWVRRLDITPLLGRDPMAAPRLSVPSIHVAGGRDAIVPKAIVRRYVAAKGGEYLEWPQADHACWPLESALRVLEELQ